MNYEINSETLAILPISEEKSKVIELNNEYTIPNSAYSIMENSCNYFGSSLEGRLQGSKNMLGSIYKAPIIVEESRNIIFFPTMSAVLPENSWISLNHILKYEKVNNKTVIYFGNNKKIEVDIPYLSIENQILRSTRLESIYKKRKNLKKSDIF